MARGRKPEPRSVAIWCWLYAGYPHFPWGESGLCSLFIERRKKKRGAEWKTENPGFVDVLYCCHGRICFSTRTESEPELWEDGFYFEVFPPIVHYCRELLLRQAEVSKKGPGFSQGRIRQVERVCRYSNICYYPWFIIANEANHK